MPALLILAGMVALMALDLVPPVVATLVAAIAVFAGLIACIVPGLYLAVRWAMAVPALLVEGRPVMESLRRSWTLVERRWWATFGLLLAGYLLPAIIAAVLVLFYLFLPVLYVFIFSFNNYRKSNICLLYTSPSPRDS